MQGEQASQQEVDKTKPKKTKRHHTHRKDVKSTIYKPKEKKKVIRSRAASKRKLSQKHKRIYGKHKDAEHLHKTIQSWKLRWKNKLWRQKWKMLWGKSKWKTSIRKRWNTDKKWRRKNMKKILKRWWDKKWRRKWMKKWIDNRWLNRWNRKRLRRKRLWKKRWRKCGAKKMGLTFNEFLLCERRLKALQRVPPAVINRRRKEKRLQKEKLIREKQEKREKFNEELKKQCISERIYQNLFVKECYGPETFGIRPSVIQFNFYMMNGLQGLVAFITVLYFHITNDYKIPREFTLQGLYTLVYFANAMDFYGSLFGMITSYHLESYYGQGSRNLRKKDKSKKQGCCKCFSSSKDKDAADEITLLPPPADSETFASSSIERIHSRVSVIPTIVLESSEDVRTTKGRAKSVKHSSKDRKMSSMTNSTGRHHKKTMNYLDTGGSRKRKRSRNSSSGSWHGMGRGSSKNMEHRRKSSSKVEVKCKCTGLGFLFCCFIRQCFRPGRSREFINRMGYCSWILLQLAWFFNIFFTAYYTWLQLYYKDYQDAVARCEVSPRMKHCDQFDSLYHFLLITVGITFTLRNIFIFVIGMCFPERYLRRCQSNDPTEEMASTCSDTDIDYTKVPRQILVPHVISGGKYPYVLPGPSRPVDYMLKKINDVTEKNKKAQEMKRKMGRKSQKRKSDKRRRRVLSTYEKEAAKLVAGFKQIKRAQIPLQKGRRIPLRLPVAAAVTDVQQLPPELMTTKAWAWLYDQTSSSEEDEKKRAEEISHRRAVKWRRNRKKVKPIDSAVLTVINVPTKLPPVDDIVKEKAEKLSDRDSTDSEWSGKTGSLFESLPGSGYSSDDEYDRRESEDYMEIMEKFGSEDDAEEGEEEFHTYYRPQSQSAHKINDRYSLMSTPR